jgi:Gpi18-like mannosyltransferase
MRKKQHVRTTNTSIAAPHTLQKSVGRKFLTGKDIGIIVVLFALRRTILFTLSYVADRFLPYAPSFPYAYYIFPLMRLPRWLYSFANFDGVHYLTIIRQGYGETDLVQAFFPFYPIVLIPTLHTIVNQFASDLVVGLFISALSFFGCLLLWKKFMTELYGSRVAWYSLLALMFFPTAFFFSTLYTESTFFFLILSSLYAAHKKKWLMAGLLAACASATRVTGIFLIPALLVELWTQQITQRVSPSSLLLFFRTQWKQILCITVGALGLLGYMVFLNQYFNDPFYFAHVQSAFGAGRESRVILYPQVLFRSLKILLTSRPFDWKYFSYVQDFLAGTAALVPLLLISKKVKLSFTVFSLLSFLLPTLTGTFSSMPRYLLLCFPLFIWLGMRMEKNKVFRWLWFPTTLFFLLLNTLLFIQGYWVA